MKIKLMFVFTTFFVSLAMLTQCQDEPKINLVPSEGEKKVDVMINGELFTSYLYTTDIKKPVLWPVMSSGGNMLTRSFPLINKEGDRTDHPHHVGVWLNYGDVNGLDFWNNSNAIPEEDLDGYGTIYHTSLDKMESGAGNATLECSAVWKAPDGQKLLEEHTTYHFSVDGATRFIDRTTTLKALADKVSFTDNKEGMFAIRVARELELPTKGSTKLMDAHGNITEVKKMDNTLVKGNYRSADGVEGKDVWGTRCRWMKLGSEVKGEKVSLVIIDHPSNVGYPTYWHARDYGLFSANTLGQKIFSRGEKELNFSLEKGDQVTFNYRLVVASEDLSDDQINEMADQFASEY